MSLIEFIYRKLRPAKRDGFLTEVHCHVRTIVQPFLHKLLDESWEACGFAQIP
jgi:hypothetical protein